MLELKRNDDEYEVMFNMNFTQELVQDLKAIMGFDLRKELLEIISAEFKKELEKELNILNLDSMRVINAINKKNI